MTEMICEFWDYSLSLYGADTVADHCLILQNAHGFDVNLVLFCVWYGQYAGPIPMALLEEAIRFSETWRQSVVQPLRNVRTSMKTDQQLNADMPAAEYAGLRQDIKEVELGAEKLQQTHLQNLAALYLASSEVKSKDSAALKNLIILGEQLQADSAQCRPHFETISAASDGLTSH